jgi:hypothetical protein
MLDINIKEYDSIKTELGSLRTSISTFIMISIGGSIFGSFFVFLSKSSAASYSLPITLSLFVALFLLSIYYILIYKFISHNRYVGYLSLISQESFLKKINKPRRLKFSRSSNLIAYEYCMSKLQAYYNRQYDKIFFAKEFPLEFWSKTLKFEFVKNGQKIDLWNNYYNTKELENHWYKFKIYQPASDKKKFRKGLLLLLKGLWKEENSNSWKYPFYVTYAIFLNFFLYLGIALWYYIEQVRYIGFDEYKTYFLTGYFLMILIVMAIIFFKSVGELHSIMNGSKTINAFCWRFLQFRVEYLNAIGIKPFYSITSIRLTANHLQPNGPISAER